MIVNSYLKDEAIETRDYQVQIADKCINRNSLVVLPTGLGKTIISVFVAAKTLEYFPPQSKIIMLAPTRPLINQHYDSFVKFLTISEEKFVVLTGKVLPDDRSMLFRENQIIFFTPQTLRNDLVKRRYTLESTCLIIFDEAHHTSGDYPYTMIADEYLDQNPDGNILALTASPGASKKKIEKLCELLHIPLKNTHFRTRRDNDVKKYLKPMDIYKIGVDLTELMRNSRIIITHLIEERLHYLSQLGFIEITGDNLTKKIYRKHLVKVNAGLLDIIKGEGDKTGAYSALSINAQALILYHIMELIEQQGLDNVLSYLERKIYKEALKRSSSKAVRILASERKLREIYLELKKNNDFTPEILIHPKYQVLENLLVEELKNNTESRILVFVKLRDSVSNLVKRLKVGSKIRPVRFVGQATKSKEDKGLSQKKQIEILNEFRGGKYNVLVSTNVGEEGLDISECDMVVFYDVVASETRFIQRKGRTARHREGKVIILYSKMTNDEKYMEIVLSKLKRMNFNLKSRTDLKSHYTSQKKDFIPEIDISINKSPVPFSNSTSNRIRVKKGSQYDIRYFLNSDPSQISKKELQDNRKIIISSFLPMELGLRKELTKGNITFKIVKSKLHITIFEKVVIQIFNPQFFSEKFCEELILLNTQLLTKYELFICIFNFINFEESIPGESQVLRRKIQMFGNTNNLQVIFIDNSGELFFIVKGIYEKNKDTERKIDGSR